MANTGYWLMIKSMDNNETFKHIFEKVKIDEFGNLLEEEYPRMNKLDQEFNENNRVAGVPIRCLFDKVLNDKELFVLKQIFMSISPYELDNPYSPKKRKINSPQSIHPTTLRDTPTFSNPKTLYDTVFIGED